MNLNRLLPLVLAAATLLLIARPGFAQTHHNQKHKRPVLKPVVSATQKQPIESTDFVYVTEEPRPLQPIDDSIRYPAGAKQLGVQGDVLVRILVETDGRVSKALIDRSDSKLLEDEAVRLLKSTKFSPALDGDKPVHVWIQQTVHFRLPSNGNETPQNTKR